MTLLVWSLQQSREDDSCFAQQVPSSPSRAHALLSSHAPGIVSRPRTRLSSEVQQPKRTPSPVGQQSPTRPINAQAELSTHLTATAF